MRCGICNLVFCGNHANPRSGHECKALSDGSVVPECEKCHKKLRACDASKRESLIKRHQSGGCTSDLFVEAESKRIACAVCNVSDIREVMPTCGGCGMHHCLHHRGNHNCSAPGKLEQERIQKKEHIKQFVDEKLKRTTPSTSAISTRPTKKKALSPQVELMLLKSTAKGDSIPDDAKVYIRVRFDSAEVPAGQLPLYLHKDWTVGKMIDWIAARAKLENMNNAADASKRLALYTVTGQKANTSATIKSLLESGALTNGGGLLLLRGKGDEVDASQYM